MKLKLLLLNMFLTIGIWSQAQKEGEVRLIQPIIESPKMNERQAAIYSDETVFKNWGIQKLKLDSVMNNYTGKNVNVCICDTGKPDHIRLKNNIVESKNFTNDPTDEDGNGHSTHVAGIIVEIAPNVNLYFAKVLSNSGMGSNDGVAAGIQWCVNRGANFINMSLGGSMPSSTIKEMIDFATKEGVVIISAAGNEGQSKTENKMGYPARYDETVAIGSINDQLDVSIFSSSGDEGDIVAPGEKILSTYKNNTYRVLSGTSMATPFVTGVAALYYEKHQSNLAIERMLELGSTDMIPEGFDRYSFWGHVEPMELFEFKTPPVDDPPVSEEPKKTIWLNYLVPIATLVIIIATFFLSRKNIKDSNEKINKLEKENQLLKNVKLGEEIYRRHYSGEYYEWRKFTVNESYLELIKENPEDYSRTKPN